MTPLLPICQQHISTARLSHSPPTLLSCCSTSFGSQWLFSSSCTRCASLGSNSEMSDQQGLCRSLKCLMRHSRMKPFSMKLVDSLSTWHLGGRWWWPVACVQHGFATRGCVLAKGLGASKGAGC
jgi:hypothetical protein